MALKLSGLFQTNVSDMHRGGSVSQTQVRTEAGEGQKTEIQAKELLPGRAIRGEVVSKSGQEIQIRIGRDTIINARMEQDIQASAGQNITFEVRSNRSGMISLRPLFQNMSQENNALKALVQAGLESDGKSMQMVSAMMQEGMSIGKESLQSMYRQIMGIPESDITNVVQMNRLRIPVTSENLQQFTAYKNYEHQLLSAFSEVADEIPQTVSGLFAEGEIQEGNALIGKILSIFDSRSDTGVLVSGESMQSIMGDVPVDGIAGEAISKEAVWTQSVPNTETVLEEKIRIAGALERNEAANKIINEEASQIIHETTDKVTGDVTNGKELLSEVNGKATVFTDTEAIQRPVEGQRTENVLLPVDREQLASFVREAGGSQENVSRIFNDQMNKEEFYQLVRTLADNAKTPEQQKAVKELFVSEGFQKILKEKIESQWTLDAPEHIEKEAVSKLYERLNEQTRALTEALSEIVKSDAAIFKGVQNIRENVDFMNQLNQMYTYVQLPLKFRESSAHGELYVYTNKKNLAKKDGNISAFLHLDMEHLGTVDVYVALEQSRISTNFYLEDEESLELLEKNMELLTKRLTEKGYLTEAKVMLREADGSVMEEIVKTDKNISIISEQSFDVRA